MTERVDVVVAGLGALGSATCRELARRGRAVVGLERFALGHDRGASHDTSRILRHSYHTPGYVRLTCEAYDDWSAARARHRRRAGDRGRRARPVPAGPGDQPGRLHRRARRGRHRLRGARRRGDDPPVAAAARCRRARWCSTRPTPPSCPPGAAPAPCRTTPAPTAPTCASTPRSPPCATSARADWWSRTPQGELHCGALVVTRRRLGQRRAGRARRARCRSRSRSSR